MKYFLVAILFVPVLYASDLSYSIGEKIYKETCLSCHGVDGKADTSINFVVKPRDLSKTVLDEEQSYQIIKHGAHYWGAVADIMPSFKSTYQEKELRSVAYYISKKFNPNVEKKINILYSKSDAIALNQKDKMLDRGAKIYKRNCSWCHGLTGHGDGEASKNPELSIFPYDLSKTLLNDKQMFLYAKYGGKFWGTDKDDMPSWSKKYDDFTLKSVIKYIDKNFKH